MSAFTNLRSVLAMACLLAGTTAMAQNPPQHSGHEMSMGQAMHESMVRMDKMQATGDVDLDFVVMMREHHQGAVDMSEIYLKIGKDPEIRKMAEKIIADQKKEIGQFDAWEKAHKAAHPAKP